MIKSLKIAVMIIIMMVSCGVASATSSDCFNGDPNWPLFMEWEGYKYYADATSPVIGHYDNRDDKEFAVIMASVSPHGSFFKDTYEFRKGKDGKWWFSTETMKDWKPCDNPFLNGLFAFAYARLY